MLFEIFSLALSKTSRLPLALLNWQLLISVFGRGKRCDSGCVEDEQSARFGQDVGNTRERRTFLSAPPKALQGRWNKTLNSFANGWDAPVTLPLLFAASFMESPVHNMSHQWMWLRRQQLFKVPVFLCCSIYDLWLVHTKFSSSFS